MLERSMIALKAQDKLEIQTVNGFDVIVVDHTIDNRSLLEEYSTGKFHYISGYSTQPDNTYLGKKEK